MRGLVGVVLCLGLAAPVRAWESKPQYVEYQGTQNLFADFSYDTGWVPQGSAIQVRFALVGGSGWSASLKGRGVLGWPEALELRMLGDPAGGVLFMNIGLEVVAKLRFHLDGPTGPIDWEGDVPFLPSFDFRFGDQAAFDPFLLPGAVPRDVVVEDSIAPVRLFQVDLTDAFIPIPGIGGGFELLVGGTVSGTLRGLRFEVDDGLGGAPTPIEEEEAALRVPVGPASRTDLWARYLAVLGAHGQVELSPAVYIELGSTWELPLFTIPVTLVDTELPWDFGVQHLSFPLPDIGVAERAVDFGAVPAGDIRSHALAVANYGELDLVVDATVEGGGFTVAPAALVVHPGDRATLDVGASVTASQGALLLSSNDPDEPRVTVTLTAGGDVEQIPGDGGTGPFAPPEAAPVPAGCGCRGADAAGGASAPILVLALLARRRRRRR